MLRGLSPQQPEQSAQEQLSKPQQNDGTRGWRCILFKPHSNLLKYIIALILWLQKETLRVR